MPPSSDPDLAGYYADFAARQKARSAAEIEAWKLKQERYAGMKPAELDQKLPVFADPKRDAIGD